MHISVTAMATNSAVTAVSVATTFTVECTSLSDTNVNIAVTALSVDTAVTALPVPPLAAERSQLSPPQH